MLDRCAHIRNRQGRLGTRLRIKEILHESFENFKLQEFVWKPCRRNWMAKAVFLIQRLPTFGGRFNPHFWDIWLKMFRLPNFNMLFQLVLTIFFKSELFRVYGELITWSSHEKSLFGTTPWKITSKKLRFFQCDQRRDQRRLRFQIHCQADKENHQVYWSKLSALGKANIPLPWKCGRCRHLKALSAFRR